MEIGINLFCYNEEGEISLSRQIELMQKNGFTRTFIMSDSPEVCDENIKKIKDGGITIDTLHAPFHHINDMWKEGDAGEDMLKVLTDGLDKCARYGIPTLISHLSSKSPAPPITDMGKERFFRLLDCAKEKGVKIAFENQRVMGNISVILEERPDAHFCWDVGHEGCFTPGREFMPFFGDRTAALHIHDNMGVQDSDDHMIPFDGRLDYNRVAKHLVRAGYKGTVMLELFRDHSNLYNNMTDEEYYKRASDAARRLANIIENTKL